MPKEQNKGKEKVSPIKSTHELREHLNALDSKERYEFAKQHKSVIKNEYELSDVLNLLPENKQVRLIRHSSRLICDFNSFLTIMKALPADNQLNFTVNHIKYVKSQEEYEAVVNQFIGRFGWSLLIFDIAYFMQTQSISEIDKPLNTIIRSWDNRYFDEHPNTKKEVINKLNELIKTGRQLLDVLHEVVSCHHWFLIENCEVTIEDPYCLMQIMRRIYFADDLEKHDKRLEYALKHKVTFNSVNELIELLKLLNQKSSLTYYSQSGYKPKTFDEALTILKHLKLSKNEDVYNFYNETGLKPGNANHLARLLSYFEGDARTKITYEHKMLISNINELIEILRKLPVSHWAFLCNERKEVIKSYDDYREIIRVGDSISPRNNLDKEVKQKLSYICADKITSWHQRFMLLSFMTEDELLKFIMTSEEQSKPQLANVLNNFIIHFRDIKYRDVIIVNKIFKSYEAYKDLVVTANDLRDILAIFYIEKIKGKSVPHVLIEQDLILLENINNVHHRILMDKLHLITTLDDMVIIMKDINSKNRNELLHAKGGLIKDVCQLKDVMWIFSLYERWELVIRYSELIQNVSDLINAGSTLPRMQCIDLYHRFKDKIISFDDLLQITISIHNIRNILERSMLNRVYELLDEKYGLVKSVEDALTIMPYLKGLIPDEDLHRIILNVTHNTGDVIGALKLFSMDPMKNDIPEDWEYVQTHKDKIQTVEDLARLIENISFKKDQEVADINNIHELFGSLIQTQADRELIRSKLSHSHQAPFDKKFPPPEPAPLASTPSRRGLFSRALSHFKSAPSKDANFSVRPSMNR